MKHLYLFSLVCFTSSVFALDVTTEELPATDQVTSFDLSYDEGTTTVPGVAEVGPGGGWRLVATPLTGNGSIVVRAVNDVGPGPWSDSLDFVSVVPGKPLIILVP